MYFNIFSLDLIKQPQYVDIQSLSELKCDLCFVSAIWRYFNNKMDEIEKEGVQHKVAEPYFILNFIMCIV